MCMGTARRLFIPHRKVAYTPNVEWWGIGSVKEINQFLKNNHWTVKE